MGKNEFLIITEYCEGGDLFTRIVETGFSIEQQCIHIMTQLISAMHHIHSHGVTHRDLKPENILLLTKEQNSVIKVADFGLSKIRNEGDTVMKTVCGTWAYCAPEVIRREPYTHLVDNWTIGILMFVILAGYHPFDMYGDATESELLKSIDQIRYDFNDEVWDDISDAAKDMIRNLLQHDPNKRHSCAQLLESDWINGRVTVSTENNKKAINNLERLVALRKQMKVTMTTTLAATKFKSLRKSSKSKAQNGEEKFSVQK